MQRVHPAFKGPSEGRPAVSNQTTAEGWTWLLNSRRWHYFRGGRSLCGGFMLLSSKALEQGEDDAPENCAACRRKRLKELAARLAGKE